jgi:hypothetical protein
MAAGTDWNLAIGEGIRAMTQQGVIVHGNRGAGYSGKSFREVPRGRCPFMRWKGNRGDKGCAESCFKILNRQLFCIRSRKALIIVSLML